MILWCLKDGRGLNWGTLAGSRESAEELLRLFNRVNRNYTVVRVELREVPDDAGGEGEARGGGGGE